MAGILKRTIFMSEIPLVNGEKAGQKVKRFTDLASVVTGVGQCVEPFEINAFGMHYDNAIDTAGYSLPASYDPKDMMRRIDKIASHSPSGESTLFSDEGTVLHQYSRWMRVGP